LTGARQALVDFPYLERTSVLCLVAWRLHPRTETTARKTGITASGKKELDPSGSHEGDFPFPQEAAMDQSVRDVMTPNPWSIAAGASVLDAARIMRERAIGDVIVLENNRLCGILTDRDIVVRALAEGADPATTKVGDICSRELTTVAPTTSVAQAVHIMRSKAIRRLPVVEEEGRVVGIVSLGDFAVERDRRSTLGEISAAPPNI
jgi:CBS domain-containing protein